MKKLASRQSHKKASKIMETEEKTPTSSSDVAKMAMAASISFNKLGLATYDEALPPLEERA